MTAAEPKGSRLDGSSHDDRTSRHASAPRSRPSARARPNPFVSNPRWENTKDNQPMGTRADGGGSLLPPPLPSKADAAAAERAAETEQAKPSKTGAAAERAVASQAMHHHALA